MSQNTASLSTHSVCAVEALYVMWDLTVCIWKVITDSITRSEYSQCSFTSGFNLINTVQMQLLQLLVKCCGLWGKCEQNLCMDSWTVVLECMVLEARRQHNYGTDGHTHRHTFRPAVTLGGACSRSPQLQSVFYIKKNRTH